MATSDELREERDNIASDAEDARQRQERLDAAIEAREREEKYKADHDEARVAANDAENEALSS